MNIRVVRACLDSWVIKGLDIDCSPFRTITWVPSENVTSDLGLGGVYSGYSASFNIKIWLVTSDLGLGGVYSGYSASFNIKIWLVKIYPQ